MQGWTIPTQGARPDIPAANLSPQPTVITPADLRKVLFKRKWVILVSILVGIAARGVSQCDDCAAI